MASRLQDVILRGLASVKPVATSVAPGTLYYSTDTQITERSDGTIWQSYTDAGSSGGGGINQLTGDVTAGPGTGSQAATLANTAVIPGSYTKADLTVDAKGRITAAANGSTTVPLHAPTHSNGGTDAVDVKSLAGYPGGTTTFLRGDNTFAVPPPTTIPTRFSSTEMILDGGASVISTGLKGFIEIPFACTILAVTLLADVSGSIVIDIWKQVYASYPPTVANTITASAKPTISSAVKSQDSTLTGWTTAVNAGDILGFNVDSVSTIKRVTLSLKLQVT